MALQLIGGARTEADIILSYLNLPRGGTFCGPSLLTIENKLGTLMRAIGKEQMQKFLEEEVLAQLVEERGEDDYIK